MPAFHPTISRTDRPTISLRRSPRSPNCGIIEGVKVNSEIDGYKKLPCYCGELYCRGFAYVRNDEVVLANFLSGIGAPEYLIKKRTSEKQNEQAIIDYILTRPTRTAKKVDIVEQGNAAAEAFERLRRRGKLKYRAGAWSVMFHESDFPDEFTADEKHSLAAIRAALKQLQRQKLKIVRLAEQRFVDREIQAAKARVFGNVGID